MSIGWMLQYIGLSNTALCFALIANLAAMRSRPARLLSYVHYVRHFVMQPTCIFCSDSRCVESGGYCEPESSCPGGQVLPGLCGSNIGRACCIAGYTPGGEIKTSTNLTQL